MNTMSDVAQSCARSAMISAPLARYASSLICAASPAPVSTATRKPILISFSTTSGTVATRFSSGEDFARHSDHNDIRTPLQA